MRVAFVYPNPRAGEAVAVARGEAPDTGLLGENHLAAHGVEASIHDPWLTRTTWPGPLQRIAWSTRELVLPWEVGRVDVVFTALGKLLPLAARMRPGLTTVVANYGLNQVWRRSSAARRRILRASLASAARVICFGRSQATGLVALGAAAEDRVETILLGVDEQWFVPTPLPDGEPVVLSVGKDLARDYVTLAEAMRPLPARCDVVALPRNVDGAALPPNVAFKSRLPVGELRRLYAESSCFVLAQRREDFLFGTEAGGLTALVEAMAMAKPIVATERAVIHDYVDDGVEALIVPAEDPLALRGAIERVLADRALAQRLGAAARARVERSHTTRGFAAQLAPLLRDVVYARSP